MKLQTKIESVLAALVFTTIVALAADTVANVKVREVPLRFVPEFEAPGALVVDHFDFRAWTETSGASETSFSLPVSRVGNSQVYKANLGLKYLLEPGPNFFEFKAVSDKGIVGGPSTLTLNYVAPTPTPVPDPVPPPFKAEVDDDSILSE